MATKVISPSTSKPVSRQRLRTKFFGELDYDPNAVFLFPAGVPGFEDHHEYLFLNIADCEPLMFLQSLTCRTLCFVLLPIFVVDPGYRLHLSPEELIELDLPLDREPSIGTDILCAALICASPAEPPTANLMAPLVVNLRTKTGKQVVCEESGYSHRHPLRIMEHTVPC
jgi:flagellar assembly factor FliW